MCQRVDTCKNTGTQKRTQLIWCKLYTSFLELNTSFPMDSSHIYILNTLIGAFVHLYNIYCDSNLSSFAGTCIPQYISIYEDQDFYKICSQKMFLLESWGSWDTNQSYKRHLIQVFTPTLWIPQPHPILARVVHQEIGPHQDNPFQVEQSHLQNLLSL